MGARAILPLLFIQHEPPLLQQPSNVQHLRSGSSMGSKSGIPKIIIWDCITTGVHVKRSRTNHRVIFFQPFHSRCLGACMCKCAGDQNMSGLFELRLQGNHGFSSLPTWLEHAPHVSLESLTRFEMHLERGRAIDCKGLHGPQMSQQDSQRPLRNLVWLHRKCTLESPMQRDQQASLPPTVARPMARLREALPPWERLCE